MWDQCVCKLHPPQLHRDCPCLRPYAMHIFPQGERQKDIREQWIAMLQRADFKPGPTARVCSIHFVDGRPTKAHPYPTLHLNTPAGSGGLAAPRSGGRRGIRRQRLKKNAREEEETCVAPECARTARSKRSACFAHYPFPRDKSRQHLWVAALRRRYWTPTREDRLCSRHFMSGRPSSDPEDPDYVPTVFEPPRYIRTCPAEVAPCQQTPAVAELTAVESNAMEWASATDDVPSPTAADSGEIDNGVDVKPCLEALGLQSIHTDFPAAASGATWGVRAMAVQTDVKVPVLCYVRRDEFLALALKGTPQTADPAASRELVPPPTACMADSPARGDTRFGSTTQVSNTLCPPEMPGEQSAEQFPTTSTTVGQQQGCLNSFPTRLHDAAKPAAPVVSSDLETATITDTYIAPNHSYTHRDYTRKRPSQAEPPHRAKTMAELLAEKIREQESTISSLRRQLESAQSELAKLRGKVCERGLTG